MASNKKTYDYLLIASSITIVGGLYVFYYYKYKNAKKINKDNSITYPDVQICNTDDNTSILKKVDDTGEIKTHKTIRTIVMPMTPLSQLQSPTITTIPTTPNLTINIPKSPTTENIISTETKDTPNKPIIVYDTDSDTESDDEVLYNDTNAILMMA